MERAGMELVVKGGGIEPFEYSASPSTNHIFLFSFEKNVCHHPAPPLKPLLYTALPTKRAATASAHKPPISVCLG